MVKLLAASAPAAVLPNVFGQADAVAFDPNKTNAVAASPVSTLPLPPAPTPIPAPPGFGIAEGPFKPSWESLSNYQVPDWFRDAKLGIWAHWGPQCQPEMGDWYAQRMYQEKNSTYKFHVEKYGHPSKFGFKDVINEWKADQWEPEKLVALYKRAGAKYFAAMANHHDNLDLYDSKYQPWNSVAVGPKKDIVGGWAKAARAAGLRFAVTCHGDRAWSWYQDAQRADTTGPLAGVSYDGRMSKADGKGLWWEGLDPQDLYAQYHELGKYNWPQSGTPPIDPVFCEKFFNRTIDLLDKYQPDLLYFDDSVLPIYPTTDIGLRIAAYYYNTNRARNGGKLDAVITTKGLNAEQRRALVYDVERGVTSGSEALPWQTDTCIGSWHYERRVFDQHRYKTAKQVVQMLIDIVSKNGNLMLSVPVRGNGTIDEDEVNVLEGLAKWIEPNGEGIYATRPWKVYGEGPSVTTEGPKGQFGGARDVRAYTAEDYRFTVKGETLYAFLMDWPKEGKTTIKSLAQGSEHFPREIARVELLGQSEPLEFTRDAAGLAVALPAQKPNDFAFVFKITPKA
ncbi:MAG: alpha-L-fucosidase [Akkermansiaceae bacterium]|nr:alpha-L-fucosidase [Verrucomicrobiales bacterium]